MMPSFRHLYTKREIKGQSFENALSGSETENDEEANYEVVPTERAKALVGYLMTLKKDDSFSNVLESESEEDKGDAKTK